MSKRGSMQGRRALVSGGASGIGRAAALLLAEEGAGVLVTDRNEAGARETAETIRAAGGEAFSVVLDVIREEAWQSAVRLAEELWGGLDTLVLSAGLTFAAEVTETTLEDWRRVMAVNLDGAFLGVKHTLPPMRRSGGGSIVLVSSASGLKATPGAGAYCASKAALCSFSRSVALECAARGDGVRVNTVCPGGVRTPLWEEMPFWEELLRTHGSEAGAWEALASQTPLKRFASAEEVARGILYLASDAAAYVTGTDLVIDGGFTA